MIETGGTASDLIFLVQTFLSYIKQYPYARYQEKQRQCNTAQFVRDGMVERHLADLKEELKKSGYKTHAREIGKIEANY